MALQDQELSIVFTEGVDTKTDDKVSVKLAVLENASIGQKGTIQKRNGFDELTNSAFTSGEQLIVNRDTLAVITPESFAIKDDNFASGWRGVNSATITSISNINTTFTSINIPFDNSYPAGLQVVSGPDDDVLAINSILETSTQDLVYTYAFIRRNRDDGGIIFQSVYEERSLSNFDGGCVVELNGNVYWISKSGPIITALDVSTFAVSYTSSTLTSSAYDDGYMQVYVENGLIFVIYQNASQEIVVSSYNSSMVLQNTFTHTTESDNLMGGYSITWNPTVSLYGLFYTASNGVNFLTKAVYLTSSLVISGSILSESFNLDLGLYKVTSCYYPSTTNITAFFESPEGVVFSVSTTSTISGFPVSATSLASQAFLLNNVPHAPISRVVISNQVFTGLAFSTVGRTMLVNFRGQLVAQMSSDHLYYPIFCFCLGAINGNVLPLSTGGNCFLLANLITENFQNSSPKELKGNAIVCNSGGFSFDGVSYSELSFLAAPLGVSVSSSGASGVPAGTYKYALVYRWTDLSGNEFMSAPFTSELMEIVIAGPKNITITFKGDVPSKKTGGVVVDIYRNSLADVVFKKIGSAPVSVGDSSDQLFIDTNSNAASFPSLYTTGGILENDPPPVANIFCTHQERVFCVDEQNPTDIYFSKLSAKGEGIHFSSFLYFSAEDSPNGSYERVTGLGSLDDKLIIFKNNSIYAVFGDGPNNLGVGSFSSPKLVCSDVGCDSPRSIVLTTEGLLFKSSKGIYLLGRSLEVEYIGADVEAFNNEEITSAVLLANKNQVIFTTRSGASLTYSYYYKQWAWSTNYEAQHSILWKKKLAHLKDDGAVLVEDTDYSDAGTPITQRIVTGWIKLSGIQNFQRIKRLQFVGTWKTSHKVMIKISYDYEDYDWQEVTVTPLSSGYNRTDKPTNEQVYTGANNGVYEYEIQVARQKCEAIKIELYDFDHTGEAFSLTGMSMVVGIKKGLSKLTGNKVF